METVGAVNLYSLICFYIQNMERVGLVIKNNQICVYIQNMETVGAVSIIQSDMCVYREYGDCRSGN